MAKKNYYYTLVFTDGGPVYVTGLGEHHTAFWDCDKPPMELGKSLADDVSWGLRLNLFSAVTVVCSHEITGQPYNYADWDIEFVKRQKEEEE